ncbi:glycoside hydrolase family 65 protein [Corynebacterium sp. 320]|uniref:glycoside hydrolase family 65 protein n=1 Tax=Corynebacterium TaxID=1716 RepID=UPI00125CB59B|nr:MULTISPECIES: glycosyl hydrolase family 65 protein [Corynebacterium]KAB1504460.1 glycoside hydrolase family 65 protein [Corynebacterium sp. 320]KAB1552441.1 glycoside hydrolase family 65 protein [Corynebacterium sp. 321]KAB1554344.1 glycoside hydrolase family 65 protein [Corynebacterium sp. 319]KAB3528596.1 glycoside hydrolase family 65 protein [Corynebacterium sp. 250]KAB3539912.1 glycoside hydrolase family 65 protein [Corynebacterium sp. 366]
MSSKSSTSQLEQFLAQRRTQSHQGPNRPVDGGDLNAANFRTDWKLANADPLAAIDRDVHPVDEWAWVETKPNHGDLGVMETLFALSNGYLGLRGNPPEGRDSHAHGTFINGVHETWDIQHAEDAYGLARAGQGIVSVPDAKAMRLYIDDEPLRLGNAEVSDYKRSLDFREGVLRRTLVWRTPGGKRVRVTSERMVSFQERHVAIMSLEVELLDADAAVVISSQLLNRQDGEDEFPNADRGPMAESDEHFDPRKGEQFKERVFLPKYQKSAGAENATLGYQVNHSGMTVAATMDHILEVDNPADAHGQPGVEISTEVLEDVARVTYHLKGNKGMKLRLEKFVAYHSSRHVAPEELAFRCERTITRAKSVGFSNLVANQRKWLGRFWKRSDVRIEGQPELQQAVRWNLFQLLQASARAEFNGIPAKGMTGSGYGGHYFWDTEIYVMPFLCYTNPAYARNALRFRYDMLPAAKQRALELSHDGALFPWRTINGQESSAYYAAGTAQYHIDADIVFALMKYVYATGDVDFLLEQGIYILINTARFWMSLGFFNADQKRFEIHSVTGPDEYTTVVNNNLYTNVMARFNLSIAAAVAKQLREERPGDYEDLARREGLSDDELALWVKAAECMYIPFNERLGVNPQDDQFLQREIWDLDDPDAEPKRPLLLHYHPLTIYRYQVLKQADVVLALFLQGQEFLPEIKKADYDYYDRLTTGDSTLSAVVQSIMAAELGYEDKALDFFHRGLFVDLGDLHGNTSDGVHIASCGGVWSALTNGFGGLRDHYGHFSIYPRLPRDWESLTYYITLSGVRLEVCVRDGEVTVSVDDGDASQGVQLIVMGESVEIGGQSGRESVTVHGQTVLSEGAAAVAPSHAQYAAHRDESGPEGPLNFEPEQ